MAMPELSNEQDAAAKKFEIDIACNKCGSHSCFFFKKDVPFNTYSFSIGCHDCGASEDY